MNKNNFEPLKKTKSKNNNITILSKAYPTKRLGNIVKKTHTKNQ